MKSWAFVAVACAILMACSSVSSAIGAVYVVDQAHPRAADEGPGSEAAPWKTLHHAAATAQAGDTVLVLPGVYAGTVAVANSGTPDAPIVFRAMRDGDGPDGAVVIEGGDPGVNLRSREHVRLEGFEIRNTVGRSGVGINMDGAKHVEIIGNHIHHTRGTGIIVQYGDDCLIRDNYIHNIGGTGIHAGGRTYRINRTQFLRNHIHDNGVEDGIQIGAGEDCVLAYNYIHDIFAPAPSHTDGIQLHSGNRNYRVIGNVAHRIRSEGFMIGAERGAGENPPPAAPWIEGNIMSDGGGVSFIASSGARNSTWRHNTVMWGHWQSLWLHNNSTGGTVIGNLFQTPAGGCVVHPDSAEGTTVDYNLTAGEAGQTGPHGLRGDPMLVDAKEPGAKTPPNARLRPGSPAIDAGPDGTDIGALEYPNVYYVDASHPAATDEFYGYRALPFKTLAKACSVAGPGETIVLRKGVYREVLRPASDGVTVRAMEGEKVVLSGADLITGWTREAEGWSAALAAKPRILLRDGQTCTDYTYDLSSRRLHVSGGDPRLHVYETIVRGRLIDLAGKANVKVEGIATVNTLRGS